MMFGDDEKAPRKAALETLKAMLAGHTSEKLKGLKKPAVAIEVEKEGPAEDALESPEDEAMEGDEPSEEDKAKIAELYHKYCK